MTLETRTEEIAREHAGRVESIGITAADRELHEALAKAEQRYEDLSRSLIAMVEHTSDRAWLVKFYQENFKTLAEERAR